MSQSHSRTHSYPPPNEDGDDERDDLVVYSPQQQGGSAGPSASSSSASPSASTSTSSDRRSGYTNALGGKAAPVVTGVLHTFATHTLIPIISIFLGATFILSIIEPSSSVGNLPDYSSLDRNSTIGPALSRSIQEDTSLRSDSCQREFPLLYPQLNENAQAWRARGGIKKADVDAAARTCEGGCAHLIISNGQIFLRTLVHDWQSRTRAVLELFETAVQGASWEERQQMEGLEMVFSNADKDGVKDDRGAGWVLDKRVKDPAGQYLIPDFSFTAWPEAGIASYSEFRRDAALVNEQFPWHKKHDKLFWRGDPNVGAPPRIDLMKQVTKPGADAWSDVKRTSFWETGPGISKLVTPKEHCEHKYLLHSEGNSYSGRSKFILGCASTVILHELEWTQHFHPALISDPTRPGDQNVIKSPGDLFQGLEGLARDLFDSDRAASTSSLSHSTLSIGQRVALNANRTLTNRYLSPAATACYLRAALISYNAVLDRRSWPSANGPQLKLGGGIRPGTGAGDNKGPNLAHLHLEEMGDVQLATWQLLGGPEWPPK